MQTNHTPGPWAISQSHGFRTGAPVNAYTINGACGTVATTPNPNVADNAANARLIAAAPDLLDALRRVLRHIPADAGCASMSDDLHRARVAIARATGDA